MNKSQLNFNSIPNFVSFQVIKVLQDLMQADDDSLFSSGSFCKHPDTPYPPTDVSLFSLPEIPGVCRENYGGNPFRTVEDPVSLDDSSGDQLPQKQEYRVSTDTKQGYHQIGTGTGHDLAGYSDSNDQLPQKYQISTGTGHGSPDYSDSNDQYQISTGTGHGSPDYSDSNDQYQISPGTGHGSPDYSDSNDQYQISTGTEHGLSGPSGGQPPQISTGIRRGLPDYSGSDDSMEYLGPSRLSIIPEECSMPEEDESYENQPPSPRSPQFRSHDNRHRSHDSLLGTHDPQFHPSHDLGQAHTENSLSREYPEDNNVSSNEGVPWYQGTSQDDWQTTPAYRPKGAWSDDTAMTPIQGKVHFVNHALKFVVTEETVPALQVSRIVCVLNTRPTGQLNSVCPKPNRVWKSAQPNLS